MLKQQGITSAGDVYQIGVVLYEMLVGMPPYYNDNIKVLYQNIEKGKLKMPKYLTTEAKKFLLVRYYSVCSSFFRESSAKIPRKGQA